MGLWTDTARNTYVAAYGARVVKKVTPSGRVQVVARSPFPWSPRAGSSLPRCSRACLSRSSLWID